MNWFEKLYYKHINIMWLTPGAFYALLAIAVYLLINGGI